MSTRLPALFIGSSTEGLDVAYAIQESLEYDAEPTVWTQGIFQPGSNALADLVASLGRFKYALFVFSPDDVVKLRGEAFRAVRDNVIFESGLFMGSLGPQRCFHLLPRGVTDLRLPSDLAGVTPLTYTAGRSDANLLAALGPACNAVRRAIRAAPASSPSAPGETPLERLSDSPAMALQRYVETWNGELLSSARALLRAGGAPLSAYDVEPESEAHWTAFRRIYYFLESVSAAVLAGRIDDAQAREVFGKAVPSVWNHAHTALAMPNHAQETWAELPDIAKLAQRWSIK